MDRNVVGGFDTKPHFIPTNVHDRDYNVVSDHDAFVSMSREHKHWRLLFILGCIHCNRLGAKELNFPIKNGLELGQAKVSAFDLP
ncbi:MAG: hypothetical protein ACK5FS_01520 [Planctomycetota bacterium]